MSFCISSNSFFTCLSAAKCLHYQLRGRTAKQVNPPFAYHLLLCLLSADIGLINVCLLRIITFHKAFSNMICISFKVVV